MRLPTELSNGSSHSGFVASRILANNYSGSFSDILPTADRCSALLVLPKTIPSAHPLRVLDYPSINSQDDERATDEIRDLGEAGYVVLRPIPVEIKRTGPADYQASFLEANIAMSGSDSQDAYQALVADILDTLDVLTAEPNLSLAAAAQFQVLQTYIGRT